MTRAYRYEVRVSAAVKMRDVCADWYFQVIAAFIEYCVRSLSVGWCPFKARASSHIQGANLYKDEVPKLNSTIAIV